LSFLAKALLSPESMGASIDSEAQPLTYYSV
jgi:hypothetical protein